MGVFWKSLAAIVGGALLASMASVVLSFSGVSADSSAVAFWVVWLAGCVVAATSPSTAKAWRRLLICCAILALIMPLSSLIFAGSNLSESGSQSAGSAIGTAIGGGMIAATTGFIGFFLAAIFLTIGLLVAKDKPKA
ncbi:hypothetical protein [Halomonas piscis]|uniref:hypothetical protein n=1 Tax=Halomonas piscis TaxID=3031727 RepID=UPI0028A03540|nr:hypothetical protein [Halomonas piscis]